MIIVGKDVLLTTNFNLIIVNKVLEMLHLSKRMDGVAFWVAVMLANNDYNVSYSSASNSTCCYNRDRVNIMIIYDYNVNSTNRINVSSAVVFTWYSSNLSMVN